MRKYTVVLSVEYESPATIDIMRTEVEARSASSAAKDFDREPFRKSARAAILSITPIAAFRSTLADTYVDAPVVKA